MATTELAVQSDSQSIIQIIADVSKDPNVNVGVMEKLVDLQFRVLEEERQIELNKALARLEPRLKVLTKSKAGAKTKGDNPIVKFWYTPYEEIDRMLRPELRECGLSLSFSTRVIGDKPHFVATVQEVTKGGSREAIIPYAPDSNDQLNAPQKVASGLSYAKRVSVSMLFNLVFEGEDDNAQFAGAISTAQVGTLERLISECKNFDREEFANYLEKECGVREIALIPAQAFKEIESKLIQRKNRKA